MKTKESARLSCLGLFFLFFGQIAAAQTGALRGHALDEQGHPLVAATVALLDARDSALVAGRYCDADGGYVFESLLPGRYFVEVSLLGYLPANSPVVEVGNAALELPALTLTPNATTLSAAEIRAQKPLFEAQLDRLTVNVADKISATGLSALDLLMRCPGVLVNRQTNSLSLAGKQGVVVMVNGKASRLPPNAVVSMLSGMSAANIEKIELITTPPAGFDAEGDAGIINIVLKKNTDEGLNGTFNLLAGYGYGEKLGAGLSVNYRTARWNLFGDFNASHDRHYQDFRNYRAITRPSGVSESGVVSVRKPTDDNLTARLGADFTMSKKTVIGVLASAYQTLWTMDALNTGFARESGAVVSRLRMPNEETNRWRHLMGNVNLQQTFRPDETLNVDFDYLWYRDHNPTDYVIENQDGSGVPVSTELLRSRKDTPIRFQVAKIDYARNLGPKYRLETGLKGTLSRFRNDVSVEEQTPPAADWTVLPDYTNEYRLRENIGAAYASLRVSTDVKISLQFGLRYEYTTSELLAAGGEALVDRQYGYLFPTLFWGYDPNDEHHFGVAYKRRITRPTFNDLAPFVIFLDPNTYLSGNSALQPSITDGVKADYRFKSYIVALEFSHDRAPIANFQPRVVADENRQTFVAENMLDRNTVNLTLTAPFHVGSWWDIQANAGGSWQAFRTIYEGVTARLEQASAYAYVGQTFRLPGRFNLELTTLYYSPAYFGLAKFQDYFLLDAGLQKELNAPWGSLRLAFSNVFNTNAYRGVTDLADYNLYSTFDLIFEPPAVRLSWSRPFGSAQVKQARQRAGGSEDERRRVRQ